MELNKNQIRELEVVQTLKEQNEKIQKGICIMKGCENPARPGEWNWTCDECEFWMRELVFNVSHNKRNTDDNH